MCCLHTDSHHSTIMYVGLSDHFVVYKSIQINVSTKDNTHFLNIMYVI